MGKRAAASCARLCLPVLRVPDENPQSVATASRWTPKARNTVFAVFSSRGIGRTLAVGESSMRADIFIDKTAGGVVEISVVRNGFSAGAGHKYETVEKARSVLLTFGLDLELIDRQLWSLSSVTS